LIFFIHFPYVANILIDSVADNVERLYIENIKYTEISMKSASDFAASVAAPFKGLGTTSHFAFGSVILFDDEGRNAKPALLIPSTSDFQSNDIFKAFVHTLEDSVSVQCDLGKVSETKGAKTTQRDHLEKLIAISKGLVTSTGDKPNATLESYGCGRGFASSSSVPDGVNEVETTINDECIKFARGIFEMKDNTSTPAEATRQGISEAFNLAITQLVDHKIKHSDIMIPIVGSNGYLIEFSCLVLLPPSFPMVVKLSKVLDLTDNEDVRTAAGYFMKINDWYSTSLQIDPNFRTLSFEFKAGLSLDKFYLKPLNTFFSSKDDLDSSVMHYLRVMRHLYQHINNEYRQHVLFPLCIRCNGDESDLVFPLLDNKWTIGLPKSSLQRQNFLASLRNIMDVIHSCGVVHMDFYLSNIMWKVGDANSVFIKIIDWDAAHFDSEPLGAKVLFRMTVSGRKELSKKFGSEMKHHDIALLTVIERNIDNEALQINIKGILDKNFRKCVEDFA